MDQLFIGMINSNYDESFKRAFIERFVISGATKDTASTECLTLIKESFVIAVTAEKELPRQMGERVYLIWAQHHEKELAQFLHPYLIQRIMTPGVCQNKSTLLNLLNESLKVLKQSSHDLLHELVLVIQSSCLNFLTEDDSLEIVKALACLLLTHKDCVPDKDALREMGQIILKIISQAEIPNVLGKQSPLVIDIQLISLFYKEINSRLGSDYFLSLLYIVFVFLTQSVKEPSIAVEGLVESLNLTSTPEIISQLMSDELFKSSAFNILLQRLIDGLLWPVNSVTAGWIISIMKELSIAGRFSLLIEVSQAKIKQILDVLTYGEDKKGVMLVFKYILLSYQHSPDIFHKIVEFIPSTISELEVKILPEEKVVLHEIAEVLHTMMFHHAGFPQLYDPLLLAIKSLPKPSNERMSQLINENRWLPAKCGYATYHPSCLSRSITGRIGLVNFGNTCYMNCVVQALYSTYEFSTAVLSSCPSPEQKILSQLQKVFAYLAHSQRVAFKAANFFQSSCPPWFISNHQQDCSEYLRYLLDLLHEQENLTEQKRTSEKYGDINCLTFNKNATIKDQRLNMSTVDSRPTSSAHMESKNTLVRSKFVGQLVSSYHCLKCGLVSEHAEEFIDLHLAFPENQKSIEMSSFVKTRTEMRREVRKVIYDKTFSGEEMEINQTENINSRLAIHDKLDENLNLQTMLRNYFEMEKLEGENKYHCENCNNLTDALRSIRITNSPKHLILTLLRFSYDFRTHKRSKIQTNVHYPLKLKLPVCTKSLHKNKSSLNESNTLNEQNESSEQLYYLYAVVIHSGVSSENGHYYTYARPEYPIPDNDEQAENSDEQWYLFNDSSVSYCTSSSFRTVTERFPKDTAYVLFYRKIKNKKHHKSSEDPKLVVLKKELREEIDRDNLQYLKEEEERLLRLQRCSPRFKYKKFDDNHPPGSCGGGGGSPFGFSTNNIPRFVS